MKERPILFSADMVRAILEGRKTQTRRPLRLEAIDILPMPNKRKPNMVSWVTWETMNPNHGRIIRCRYGKPGDQLWVRETWHHSDIRDHSRGYCSYRADGEFTEPFKKLGYKWKPSIFMPRWASRITLEIVSVKCERLSTIKEKDAVAEGIPAFISSPSKIPVMQFATLWDSLNASRGFGWDKNPWVWVIEFKKI